MRLRWPSRCTFRTWGVVGSSQGTTGHPGTLMLRTDQPGLRRAVLTLTSSSSQRFFTVSMEL